MRLTDAEIKDIRKQRSTSGLNNFAVDKLLDHIEAQREYIERLEEKIDYLDAEHYDREMSGG